MRLEGGTVVWSVFFFQAEDGIRDLVRSRGLGDVYKRQILYSEFVCEFFKIFNHIINFIRHIVYPFNNLETIHPVSYTHLRAHETVLDLVCRLLLEKKKNTTHKHTYAYLHLNNNIVT